VRDLFFARFHVSLRRLPKGSGKTAGYEFAVAGERAAVVEVKRLGWRPRTRERGWHVTEGEDGVRHAMRDDNAPDRMGTAIHEACKQLRNYADPKILVFVNDERLIDVGDLDEAFKVTFRPRRDEERWRREQGERCEKQNVGGYGARERRGERGEEDGEGARRRSAEKERGEGARRGRAERGLSGGLVRPATTARLRAR
jgi:hypothetical protein